MTYTDQEKDDSLNAFKAAAERYLQIQHDDDTMVLEGIISMANGSGVVSGERLSTVISGTKVTVSGLLHLLDRDVVDSIDSWNDREA